MGQWKLKGIKGATPKLYYKILKAQDNKCAICGRAPQKRGLAVDHNHQTGAIRGLLCFRCNTCLGWFERMLSVPGKVEEIRDTYLNNNWGLADFPIDEIDDYIDSKRPNVAMRRSRVVDRMDEMTKDNPDMDWSDLIEAAAKEFNLSTRTVQRYLYREREIAT